MTTDIPNLHPDPERATQHAYLLLRTVFTIAPIAFGLDKFFNLLVDWEAYLAPWIDDLVPGTAAQAMAAVGVIEIVAGILVAVAPRLGSLVVAAWLVGIIVNLVSMGEYYDIALRDLGLLAGALGLHLVASSSAPAAYPDSASTSRRARSSSDSASRP